MLRSDTRNKEIALGKIKRLSSSGLPLEPFVRSVFELINDAVPNSPNRTFHVGGKSADNYLTNTLEMNELIQLHTRYYVESAAELSGAKFRIIPAVLHKHSPTKVIWEHEELGLPGFYRSEGFNTVFRPWGLHHCLMLMFQEAGEFVGCYPIWRGIDQKPFSRTDVDFMRLLAPHITHGLKAAQLLARVGTAQSADFAPLRGWGSGIILIDSGGKPIAWDSAARLIFQQLGVLEGVPVGAFARQIFGQALDHVRHNLNSIFRDSTVDCSTDGVPIYRLYHHRTGIVLKLRGVHMLGADGREYVTVLVERGEALESRRSRLRIRWGLSHRENEVLSLVAEGKTGPEISILLRISHDTARKHMSRIFERLGVENRTAAAAMVLSGDLA